MCDIKFSDTIYITEVVQVKPEFYMEYRKAVKAMIDAEPEKATPLVGMWELDQGGPALTYILLLRFASQKEKLETQKKLHGEGTFEKFITKIGPMVNQLSLKTYRALPGFELQNLSKGCYYEAVRYEFSDPRAHKWAPQWCNIQKQAQKHLEKCGGHTVGAFACEYGAPTGGLLYIVQYPSPEVHMKCFDAVMSDKTLQESIDKFAPILRHIENSCLKPCEEFGCFK